MPEITLTATPPNCGELPVTHGAMTLTLADPGPLTLIAPHRGQTDAVAQAVTRALGLGLPPTGRMAQGDGITLQWFGRGQYLVSGASGLSLSGAAMTDQSDGWVAFDLTGPALMPVLSRLIPIAPDQMPVGAALRTDLHGMMIAMTRPAPNGVRIMGFRSMARSLRDTITEAMERVAALN